MARWGELEGDGEKEAKYKHVLWLDVDSLAESVALVFAVLVLWAVLVGAEFDIHGVFSLLCVRVGGLVRPHWLLHVCVRACRACVRCVRCVCMRQNVISGKRKKGVRLSEINERCRENKQINSVG